MKRQFINLLFLISLVFSVSAQNMKARKIDELGDSTCEDIKARLDTFAYEVADFPQAKGFIISYEGRYNYDSYGKNVGSKFQLPVLGESVYRNNLIKQYLVESRGISADKLLFISGGFRENYTLEFWIVPAGAKMPAPTLTLDKTTYRKGKFRSLNCS